MSVSSSVRSVEGHCSDETEKEVDAKGPCAIKTAGGGTDGLSTDNDHVSGVVRFSTVWQKAVRQKVGRLPFQD